MDEVNENDGKISKRRKKPKQSKSNTREPKKNERIDMSEQTKMLLLLSMLVNPSDVAVFIDDLDEK